MKRKYIIVMEAPEGEEVPDEYASLFCEVADLIREEGGDYSFAAEDVE